MLDRSARRILVAVVFSMALGVFGLWALLAPAATDAERGPAAEVAREEEGPHVAQGAPPVQNREEVHKIAVEVDSQPSAETPIPPAPLHEHLISELVVMPLPPPYNPMIGSGVVGVNYGFLASFRNTSEYRELMAQVSAQGQEGASAVMDHIMSIVRARHEAGLESCAGNMGPLLELGHMEPGYALCLPLILPEIDASRREVGTLIQFVDEDVAAQTESVRSRLPDKKEASAISMGALFMIHALDGYLSAECDAHAMDPASISKEQLAVLKKYGRLKGSIRSVDSDANPQVALNDGWIDTPPDGISQIDYDRHLVALHGTWVPTEECAEPSYDEEILELARAYWN